MVDSGTGQPASLCTAVEEDDRRYDFEQSPSARKALASIGNFSHEALNRGSGEIGNLSKYAKLEFLSSAPFSTTLNSMLDESVGGTKLGYPSYQAVRSWRVRHSFRLQDETWASQAVTP